MCPDLRFTLYDRIVKPIGELEEAFAVEDTEKFLEHVEDVDGNGVFVAWFDLESERRAATVTIGEVDEAVLNFIQAARENGFTDSKIYVLICMP
jgi:hypothetical protein